MSRPVVLEAVDVSVTYGSSRSEVRALVGVTFTLQAGEAVALRGPSGCGKSTLLGVLGLIQPPSAGSLLIDGHSAARGRRERAALRNHFFGYLHQEFALLNDLTVERNVAVPLEYARPRVKRSERRGRVRSVIAPIGLESLLRERVKNLSGGERQRVAIARALVNTPSVILADEPTGALDSATSSDVMELLLSVRERGAAVIIATHDDDVANRCDRTLHLLDGHLVG